MKSSRPGQKGPDTSPPLHEANGFLGKTRGASLRDQSVCQWEGLSRYCRISNRQIFRKRVTVGRYLGLTSSNPPSVVMKKTILAATVSLIGALYSQAQSVVTDPVGFVSVTIPGQSDAALGAPLGRANEYQGVVQSVSGSVITVAGTTGWLTNQFVYVDGTQPKTYYARIDSGAREGLIAQITANDASTITVTVPAGDDIAAVLAGDSISVAPYWTLGTLITGVPNGTQVLTYSTTDSGINLSASVIYFSNGGNWFLGATPSNDVVLPPNLGFTIRNGTASPITISITGSVPMAKNRFIVRARIGAGKLQDQRIFFNSPVPEYVGNLGLGLTLGDQLLVFDNSAVGKNKSARDILSWAGPANGWLLNGDPASNYQLQPGSSYVLRKAPSSTTTLVSTQLQSYLQ